MFWLMSIEIDNEYTIFINNLFTLNLIELHVWSTKMQCSVVDDCEFYLVANNKNHLSFSVHQNQLSKKMNKRKTKTK